MDEPNGSLYRYRFGQVEFDEARFELRIDGLVVELERRPLLVLLELLRGVDEVVTHEWLLDTVWEGRPTVRHALSNCILKLRRALGPEVGKRIETVSKGGYRLVGPVHRVSVGRRVVTLLNLATGDPVPTRAGHRLERQLGSSLGNEVWVARRTDGEGRSVFKFSRNGEALEVLKRETRVHRYLVETLGDRNDIVPMLSWHFDSQPCFIETEYCGENLAQWATTEGRLAQLSLNERLEVFLHVSDAVAAAHSVAVLHKDLKPTNIFVSQSPGGIRVKVGDFGNASLLEPHRLEELGITRLGMTLSSHEQSDPLSGTPFYLAPELIAGAPATMQTDVYALGLLLFQLVVGDLRRPMASGWEPEVSDVSIREDILLATAGDPQLRLSSVAELTSRIRDRDARQQRRLAAAASLQEAEIVAKALEKATARRPWVIASLVALLAGLAAAIYMYGAERAARRVAELEQRRSQAINSFLNETLQRADPTAPGGLANTTIESAIGYAAQTVNREFANDPVIKGSIDLTLGNAFQGLSQFDKALELQRDAAASLNSALGPSHPSALEASYHLAGTLDMLSRHKEARTLLDQTDLAAGEQLRSPSRLSFLAHSTRGGNFLLQMQAAPALEEFLLMEDIRSRVDPDNIAWLVNSRSDIAWCEVRLDRDADALRALSDLITPAYQPERIGVVEWLKLHLQYGMALANLARFDESAAVLQNAEQEAEHDLGKTHYLVALSWNYLAASYKAAGAWNAAADAANREYALWSTTIGQAHQSTLAALTDVAAIDYLRQGNDSAFNRLRTVHDALDLALGSGSPFAQYGNFFYVSALLDHGLTEEASRIATGLDAQALASADPSPYWEPRLQWLRGRVFVAQNKREEGNRLLNSALSTLTLRNAQAWMTEPVNAALRESAVH